MNKWSLFIIFGYQFNVEFANFNQTKDYFGVISTKKSTRMYRVCIKQKWMFLDSLQIDLRNRYVLSFQTDMWVHKLN